MIRVDPDTVVVFKNAGYYIGDMDGWHAVPTSTEATMTRDEVKEYAKRYGMKVRENWVDDWRENAVWAVCGFGLGYIARVVWVLIR